MGVRVTLFPSTVTESGHFPGPNVPVSWRKCTAAVADCGPVAGNASEISAEGVCFPLKFIILAKKANSATKSDKVLADNVFFLQVKVAKNREKNMKQITT